MQLVYQQMDCAHRNTKIQKKNKIKTKNNNNINNKQYYLVMHATFIDRETMWFSICSLPTYLVQMNEESREFLKNHRQYYLNNKYLDELKLQ